MSKLEASWGPLGGMLAPCWRSWGHLGAYWLQVEGSWGHLGSKLEGLGAILAPTWEVLGGLGQKAEIFMVPVGSWGCSKFRQPILEKVLVDFWGVGGWGVT